MYTPETLRGVARIHELNDINGIGDYHINVDLLGCADAWEKDRLAGHEWRIEGEELRKRLEEAVELLARNGIHRPDLFGPAPEAPKEETCGTSTGSRS